MPLLLPATDRPNMTSAITVLHSLAAPDGTTKYVNQIAEGAPADVRVRYFSWRTALRSDYDVLHLHWPELLLRARTRRKRLAKRIAMRMLLARLRRTGVPLVRTVHNVQPHETTGGAEERLLARIDRSTDLFIRLNPTTRPIGSAPVTTILHGHYRDRFAAHPRYPAVPGRVMYFGLIRPYKGLDRLIEVVPRLAGDGVTLRIVGSPSAEMRALVEAAALREPTVSAELSFVPDAQLVAEVSTAELIVLPYRELHNSGVLLVALSLDKPVLVPRSAAADAMAEEVGDGWITQFDGDLDASDVAAALTAARAGIAGRPRLDGRDWALLGEHHAAAYRRALARSAA